MGGIDPKSMHSDQMSRDGDADHGGHDSERFDPTGHRLRTGSVHAAQILDTCLEKRAS